MTAESDSCYTTSLVALSPQQRELFILWAKAAAAGDVRMTLGLAREIERATGIPQSAWADYVASDDKSGHNVNVATPGQMRAVQAMVDARRVNGDHPWVSTLIKQGTSVAEWARKRGVSRQLVNSWITKSETSGRAIPRRWFNVIRDELSQVGVDISESDFPRGVR